MKPSTMVLFGVLIIGIGGAASAHFRLLAPASIHKGENGGKGAPPCGEGPASDIVTDEIGGHPLHLRIQEFVFHPGHYRVALSVKSRAQLPPDPDVASANGKSISAIIQNPPAIPVLFDGLFAHTSALKEELQTDIALPNVSCERCTLQVIEFMAEHGANPGGGFFYHHCADLRITSDPALPPADAAWSRSPE